LAEAAKLPDAPPTLEQLIPEFITSIPDIKDSFIYLAKKNAAMILAQET